MGVIKFIDLFAGIGGFRYGLEKANKKFKCVWSNEWDKYASSIYKKHYGECDTRDITTVPSSEIPDHDLLVGGFPCQSFSIAGKRLGFSDTRGTLFFEISRILADKRPRYFILENVKGLLSSDEGKTFQTILGVLTDLGYEYQWQVLNSKNFGVPQNRERVFIIGHLRGTPRPKVLPVTSYNPKALRELTQNQSQGFRVYDTDGVSTTLAGLAGGLGAKTGMYAVAVDHGEVKEKMIANTLDANYYKGIDNHQARTGVMVHPMRWVRTEAGKEARRQSKAELGKDYTPFNGIYRKLEVAEEKGEIGCLTNALNKDALLGDGIKIRRLTPIECERLQGFPDGWTEGISDTQRYKCLGNAVTTNVVSWIGKRLI